jgi:quinoprotein glucose dehydrogenase
MTRTLGRWPLVTTAIILTLLGLLFAGLGIWLVVLGGTLYYAFAGAALLASGWLIGREKIMGAWLFGILLAVTVFWSIYEVGFDGWAMIPRVIAPAVLGLWIFSPLVAGRLNSAAERHASRAGASSGFAICALLIAGVFGLGYSITASRFQQEGQFTAWAAPAAKDDATVPDDQWSFYGRTPAGDRYSPLAQITPQNVGALEAAWSFSTGDMPKAGENSRGREFSFEATPIKVGDTLYFCTPHRDVVALDATTGKQRWRYSPGGDMSKNIYQACRGVSYYEASEGGPCRHRIVSTASGAPELFELDADTGRLCPGFGNNGMVDLRDGLGPVPPGFHFITSPPMVLKDRIILSGWVYDNQSVQEPSGVVRAFDARSGKLVWSWDVGRTPTNKPLGNGETFTRGTPNAWGVYTADPALGLVYVPTGIATPDYFGGKRRPFDDAYNSSLVALDIETGLERWHFQLVHHDIWDFDVPVGPSLVDLPAANGATVPALVQTSKQGQLFLLDRRTGAPIAQVAEKGVPTGHLPGERYSPTQPFSTGMPSLTPPRMLATKTWGMTPIDQLACRIQLGRMRNDGLYTPSGLDKPVLGDPAFDGVIDWYGGTIDPARKILYVNYMEMPFVFTTYRREDALKKGLFKPWAGWGQPYPQPVFDNSPQHGLPYSQVVKPWLGLFGAPCVAPPWGILKAIDLVKRKVVWSRPVGTTANMGPSGLRMPVDLPTGIFMMGGNITTASGLVFMGATSDQGFRAFDGRTGKTLWETTLPAAGNATPLTYLGRDGRQYVVIAAGGHGGLRSRNGDQVIAFALDRSAH